MATTNSALLIRAGPSATNIPRVTATIATTNRSYGFATSEQSARGASFSTTELKGMIFWNLIRQFSGGNIPSRDNIFEVCGIDIIRSLVRSIDQGKRPNDQYQSNKK